MNKTTIDSLFECLKEGFLYERTNPPVQEIFAAIPALSQYLAGIAPENALSAQAVAHYAGRLMAHFGHFLCLRKPLGFDANGQPYFDPKDTDAANLKEEELANNFGIAWRNAIFLMQTASQPR